MDLTSKETIKDLLSRHQGRPKKVLGQNFLVSGRVLAKILEAADLNKGDTTLEIGPGIGTLTQGLAKSSKEVIAVEKDFQMITVLRETLAGYDNIKLIQGNILKTFNRLPINKPFKVVANLPYYITAPTIRMLLEAAKPPQAIILMVQKEVAQRICAAPPRMSLLAVSVQFYAKPKIISYVSKTSFWPQPKVDSAVIKIVPHQSNAELRDRFFKIAHAGFSQPRKQLINNFTRSLDLDRAEVQNWLPQCKIDPSQRPQTLSLADWICLTQNFPK